MNEKELVKAIKSLEPWYQNVEFTSNVSAISSHSKLSGEYAWRFIKQIMPGVAGKRVLDLGANAGLFSIKASLMGAKEVVAIERNARHVRQFQFMQEYFSTKNITLIIKNIEQYAFMNLGKFDLVFAISVLYWIGRQGGEHYSKENRKREIKFIEALCMSTNSVIVRCRNMQYNNADYYASVFKEFGFKVTNKIEEPREESQHDLLLLQK